jgi:Wax ester synthase/diacylglycerol acyltransferase catalytic domain
VPGNDQLTALDAAFLELEEADDGTLMHIGAALVFDPLPGGGTPAIGEVRDHLEQRLDLLPRYRQKLDAPRTGGFALWRLLRSMGVACDAVAPSLIPVRAGDRVKTDRGCQEAREPVPRGAVAVRAATDAGDRGTTGPAALPR